MLLPWLLHSWLGSPFSCLLSSLSLPGISPLVNTQLSRSTALSQAQPEGSTEPQDLLKPHGGTFLSKLGPEPKMSLPVPLVPWQEEDVGLKIHTVGMSHRGSLAIAVFNR